MFKIIILLILLLVGLLAGCITIEPQAQEQPQAQIVPKEFQPTYIYSGQQKPLTVVIKYKHAEPEIYVNEFEEICVRK